MIKYTLIHQQIQKQTGLSITQEALFKFINESKKDIKNKIDQITEEQARINEQRKIQGLKPLKRINTDIIDQAIHNYKNTDANTTSKNNGGTHQKTQNNELASEKKFWINPFFLNQKAPMVKLLQNYKKHGKMDWGLIPLKNNRDFVSFFFKISNPSTPTNTFFFHNPNQIRRLSTRCQEN